MNPPEVKRFLEPLMDRYHVRGPSELLDLAAEFFAEMFVQERWDEAAFYARVSDELCRLASLSP